MQEDIKNKILEIYSIISNKNIDINKVSNKASLTSDLGMNSIIFVYWLLRIEEELGERAKYLGMDCFTNLK